MEKQIEIKNIIDLLKEALKEFYNNEYDLIENDTDERAVTFRLGLYLNERVLKYFYQYTVDSEYNKLDIRPKTVYAECEEKMFEDCKRCKLNYKKHTTARPDLIIHKRMSNDNLVCIEIKKDRKDCSNDRKKLRYFTCEHGKYHYRYGILLIIGKERAIATIFENREESHSYKKPIELYSNFSKEA